MRSAAWRGVWAVWLGGAALACAAEDDPFSAVRQEIVEQIEQEQVVPSLAVAVAREGQIVWEEGFGMADREHQASATPRTMYSLASISKPITATGLMVLVQRGQLDLDRPINDYLGDAKVVARRGSADEATLRLVANHTAGLPLHYQFFYADEPHVVPPRDETIRRYGLIYTPPGEHYQYSNLGYGLLDYVIARVGGTSYSDFMRDEVFVPLGLHDTAVNVPEGREVDAATRYDGEGESLPFYDFDHPGASAVFSSANDLVRFGMFHLKDHRADQQAILSDETIDAMQQPTATVSKAAGYGIGWTTRRDWQGYEVVAHSGGMPGVATMLTLVPEADVAVVVLANGQHQFPYAIAEKILAAALPPRAKPDEESIDEPQPSGNDKSKPQGRLSSRRAGWVGHWQGEVETYAGVRPLELWFEEDRRVRVRLGEADAVELDGRMFVDDRLNGAFDGDLGTDDTRRIPCRLQLKLERHDDALCGAVIAISSEGRHVRALSHWAELQRD